MSFDTVFNSVVSPWCHVTLPTLAFAETPPPIRSTSDYQRFSKGWACDPLIDIIQLV